MNRIDELIRDLPDRDAARRFLDELAHKHPSHHKKLAVNEPLLSDVLTIAAFSPLLSTTLLAHPEYFLWLDRQRRDGSVRSKEILLESLGRFALTNSTLESAEMYARFRRRELLRIYLRDIRRLATVAEITEEISNVADVVLENALANAQLAIDERFGMPLELDQKGRSKRSTFCVVALGKLGSRELNYASDIDLVFVYSSDGETSGTGTKGKVTNREYFIKLGETLTKLVGGRSGEGGAYRVDLRLRPHGRLGALALSVSDTIQYYHSEARDWERQVLIRSRSAAGDGDLFRKLFGAVENVVYAADQSPAEALLAVKRSKFEIDKQGSERRGFNVKLGRGGIREIEFLAQALQLAHGGRDRWLRASHTLISLARLAERGLIKPSELSALSSAYDLLRRTEHILQMENGVQTHTIPDDESRRSIIARRIEFGTGGDLSIDLRQACDGVNAVFRRIFGDEDSDPPATIIEPIRLGIQQHESVNERSATSRWAEFERVTPQFAAVAASRPSLRSIVEDESDTRSVEDYRSLMFQTISPNGFGNSLAGMRQLWMAEMIRIVAGEVFGSLDIQGSKSRQTALAEASINAAIEVTRQELERKFSAKIDQLGLGVLALGKLGSMGLDYGSDLDLSLIYDEQANIPDGLGQAEFYGKAAEHFVTTLSSMTRDGNLYRVDLRLRPFGSQGQLALPAAAFIEYFKEKAAIWELLAYVKLRAVGGDRAFVEPVEYHIRTAIHERALTIDPVELAFETVRIRKALEKKSKARHSNEIDIKYDAGGLLDVYFATRFLQLKYDLRDGDARSTVNVLRSMIEDLTISLSSDKRCETSKLISGHTYLSEVDHADRLFHGRRVTLRTDRLGDGSTEIATRMIDIRSAFSSLLIDPSRFD